MARPTKYPPELRERAVRMVIESKADYTSEFEAIRSVATKLGIGLKKEVAELLRAIGNHCIGVGDPSRYETAPPGRAPARRAACPFAVCSFLLAPLSG